MLPTESNSYLSDNPYFQSHTRIARVKKKTTDGPLESPYSSVSAETLNSLAFKAFSTNKQVSSVNTFSESKSEQFFNLGNSSFGHSEGDKSVEDGIVAKIGDITANLDRDALNEAVQQYFKKQ